MPKILPLLALLLFMALPKSEAQAADYIKPGWSDLIDILAKFNAMDFSADPTLIDEYAMITECDLYQTEFHDEFKWRKIREELLAHLQQQKANTPDTLVRYETALHLDRYDFDNQLFRFTKESSVENINAFLLSNSFQFTCGRKDTVRFLPHEFRVVLNHPVTVPGIPMTPETGEALIKSMELMKNTNRIVWARFNFHITHIQSLMRYSKHNSFGQETFYYLQGRYSPNPTQMDAVLDFVEFFADPEMKISLYTYKPT